MHQDIDTNEYKIVDIDINFFVFHFNHIIKYNVQYLNLMNVKISFSFYFH